MDIRNKKILLISPRYFNYGKAICEELKKNGAMVYWINSSIRDTCFLNSVLYKYLPFCQKKLRRDYYEKKLRNQKNADIVFVIKGESLDDDIFKIIKKKNPDSTYIMYQWDSSKTEPNACKLAHYFDKVYTFDYEDSKEYGWKYRPLFFMQESSKSYRERKYDISMICIIHSKRVELYHKVKQLCDSKKMVLFKHLYCTMLGFYKCKYIKRDPAFLYADKSEISHKELSLEETYRIYSESKIVADYTFPGQTGYTMRTIECIGNKCKLITNNEYIKYADFYLPENIYIYDLKNFEIPSEFLESPYKELDRVVFQKYTLDEWINEVLG